MLVYGGQHIDALVSTCMHACQYKATYILLVPSSLMISGKMACNSVLHFSWWILDVIGDYLRDIIAVTTAT